MRGAALSAIVALLLGAGAMAGEQAPDDRAEAAAARAEAAADRSEAAARKVEDAAARLERLADALAHRAEHGGGARRKE